MNQDQMIGSFSDLTAVLVREAWGKELYDVAFSPTRSWTASRVPKSSRGIDGLVMNVPFLTGVPWSIRGITEDGVTPTADKFSAASQKYELGAAAATAGVSLWQLEACKSSTALMKDMVNAQLGAIRKTVPYFMKMLLWTSNSGSAIKEMGKGAGAISGTTVTLDNDGLWHSANAADRAKLFEPGMNVQLYRGTAKVGAPVKITSVNKKLGTITLASDPGYADNDTFVMADKGGLDRPYMANFPGFLDAVNNANTFQNVDRSAAGNEWAQAIVQSASGLTFGYDLFSTFFYDAYNPKQAFTNPELVRKYYTTEVREGIRFTPTATYVDGFQFVQIDGTQLIADEDMDRDKVLIPDWDNLWIATPGDWTNLFGKGWQQVPKSFWLEYTLVWWGRLVAADVRKCALLKEITLP